MALSGLITDWGGVLTVGLREAVGHWAAAAPIDPGDYVAVMREWFGQAYGLEAAYNPVHALEKGELEVPNFEEHLAEALSTRAGRPIPAAGLVERMLGFFRHSPDMIALVRRAKEKGIRTALLSNSWGMNYPRDLFDGMFDALVISGEVGMRKPDREIYDYALRAVGLPAAECVFVDDLLPNVLAAREAGMVAIHHTDYETTAGELDALFGTVLSH
jgi:epoxide hydrolase-like predicted phosphatase